AAVMASFLSLFVAVQLKREFKAFEKKTAVFLIIGFALAAAAFYILEWGFVSLIAFVVAALLYLIVFRFLVLPREIELKCVGFSNGLAMVEVPHSIALDLKPGIQAVPCRKAKKGDKLRLSITRGLTAKMKSAAIVK
ncbi:MAG: hypothetical protein V1834_03205, partial [Candidatus Micrarchaeota archaeon]